MNERDRLVVELGAKNRNRQASAIFAAGVSSFEAFLSTQTPKAGTENIMNTALFLAVVVLLPSVIVTVQAFNENREYNRLKKEYEAVPEQLRLSAELQTT